MSILWRLGKDKTYILLNSGSGKNSNKIKWYQGIRIYISTLVLIVSETADGVYNLINAISGHRFYFNGFTSIDQLQEYTEKRYNRNGVK